MQFQPDKGERTLEWSARALVHIHVNSGRSSNTCPNTILERQLNNINIRFQHFMMENQGEEMSEMTQEIQEYKIYRVRKKIFGLFILA